MTVAEAHAAAAAEGLALLRDDDNKTGFKGVYRYRGVEPWRPKPFKAELNIGGRTNSLGTYATAEEAALAVARFLGPAGAAAALAPPAPEPMSNLGPPAAAARQSAWMAARGAAAGVPRRGANCHAGYHVATPPMCSTGMTTVRHPAGPGAFAAGEAHQRFVHAARADAVGAAEAEGLTLLRADNSTGYRHVTFSYDPSEPYEAKIPYNRRTVAGTAATASDYELGTFVSAEAAALAVARVYASAADQSVFEVDAPDATAAVAAAGTKVPSSWLEATPFSPPPRPPMATDRNASLFEAPTYGVGGGEGGGVPSMSLCESQPPPAAPRPGGALPRRAASGRVPLLLPAARRRG